MKSFKEFYSQSILNENDNDALSKDLSKIDDLKELENFKELVNKRIDYEETVGKDTEKDIDRLKEINKRIKEIKDNVLKVSKEESKKPENTSDIESKEDWEFLYDLWKQQFNSSKLDIPSTFGKLNINNYFGEGKSENNKKLAFTILVSTALNKVDDGGKIVLGNDSISVTGKNPKKRFGSVKEIDGDPGRFATFTNDLLDNKLTNKITVLSSIKDEINEEAEKNKNKKINKKMFDDLLARISNGSFFKINAKKEDDNKEENKNQDQDEIQTNPKNSENLPPQENIDNNNSQSQKDLKDETSTSPNESQNKSKARENLNDSNEETPKTYKREFEVYYTNDKKDIQDKINKFFGTDSDDNPGTVLSKFLKKSEEKQNELEKEEASLKKPLNSNEDSQNVAEAIINKDFDILNEIDIGNIAKSAKLKLGNLAPKVGRISQSSKGAKSSWENYKNKMREYADLYRSKAEKLFDLSSWDTTPTKKKQDICHKLNLLSINYEADMRETFNSAVKRNKYSELGAIKYDMTNIAKETAKKIKDKYNDSTIGRSNKIDSDRMKSKLPNFMKNLSKLDPEDQNMLAYSIVYPDNIKLKADPSNKNSPTIEDSLKELINKDGVSVMFGIGNEKNLIKFLKMLNDDPRIRSDKNINNLAVRYQEELSTGIVRKMSDYFTKCVKTIVDSNNKKRNINIPSKNEFDNTSGQSSGINNDAAANAANFSVVTENILYKKFVLKEDIHQINPINSLILKDNGYFEALRKIAYEYYGNKIPRKEIEKRIPTMEKALNISKKENPELYKQAKEILLSPINTKTYAKKVNNGKVGPISAVGKAPVLNNRVVATGNKETENNPINIGKSGVKLAPQQSTVTTMDVGSATIPDRLYKKLIRRKIKD